MNDHEEHSLAKAINALREWLAAHCGCATKQDLRETEHRLAALIVNQQPKRYIRLHVAQVQFVQPDNGEIHMPDNLSLDVPAGKIARVTFQPFNEKNEPAKLDGPLTAVLMDDSPTTAEIAVGGPGGLIVDIKPLDEEGSVALVEVDGDADLDPAKREVLTTLVTVRRLGAVPGKAVSLGAKPENVTFVGADQFGVFPDAAAKKK